MMRHRSVRMQGNSNDDLTVALWARYARISCSTGRELKILRSTPRISAGYEGVGK